MRNKCFNYLHFFLQSPSPSRVDRTCPLEEEIKLLNLFIQKNLSIFVLTDLVFLYLKRNKHQLEISDYFTGESQKEKIHGILEKTKVPYQGSWRKVFEQTYSQQTDNKEQTGKLENLFSIQNLKISIIGFVIVPVMCILAILNTNGVTMKIFNNFWLKANFPQNNQAWFRPIYR